MEEDFQEVPKNERMTREGSTFMFREDAYKAEAMCKFEELMNEFDKRKPGNLEAGSVVEDFPLFTVGLEETALSAFSSKARQCLEIMEKYALQGKAEHVTLYIEEAHPVDEWDLFSHVDFKQPKLLEERCAVAKKFLSALKMPESFIDRFALDSMSNTAEKTFSAWPERLYVLQPSDGKFKVLFKGGMGPEDYSPEAVDKFLEDLLTS